MCVASRSPGVNVRLCARGWTQEARGETRFNAFVQLAVKIQLLAVTVCAHDDDSLKTTVKYSDWFKF